MPSASSVFELSGFVIFPKSMYFSKGITFTALTNIVPTHVSLISAEFARSLLNFTSAIKKLNDIHLPVPAVVITSGCVVAPPWPLYCSPMVVASES